MFRPVSTLKIPELVRLKLQESGYQYCEDLQDALLNSDSIPKHMKTLLDEYNISEQLDYHQLPHIGSGIDAWRLECSNSPVAVFHKGLDKLLKGGLPISSITEICGGPGSGKTQMCLQFCVDVQMPSTMGGSEGEALYISTDFGFRVERFKEIAKACIEHCSKLQNRSRFTLKSFLDGVNVVEVHGYEDLSAVVSNISDYLSLNRSIKLLIIDNFSLPLVQELTDLLKRTKVVYELLGILQDISIKFSLAIVLTNQLTTLVLGNNDKKLIPSLGEGFGHRVHQRLLLDEGKIYLSKSVNHPQMYTTFQITKSGIR